MSRMTAPIGPVTGSVRGGVDTHSQAHHAAVIDHLGRPLGDREFPASPGGYQSLLAWMRSFGELGCVGVEGTGAYGVGLLRQPLAAGATVVRSTGRIGRPRWASPTRSTPTPPPAPR